MLYIHEYKAKKKGSILPANDTLSFHITDTAYQFQYQVWWYAVPRVDALIYLGPAIQGSSDTTFGNRSINP